jgi:hypothetical protein
LKLEKSEDRKIKIKIKKFLPHFVTSKLFKVIFIDFLLKNKN